MTKTYRAVLVGTGSICDAHLRAVEATEGRVELVAAVDLDAERVNAFCARTGVPHAYTDFDKMLQEIGPDIALIATPPGSHTAMSIAAMEVGAWVLCEKPLCGSLAEMDRIREVEQRTGCYTACVFQMRFASSNVHLKRLADSGQLGRPLVGVCNTMWYRDDAYYAVPWRGKWNTELGGPTMGLGIHAMDHFLDIMGDWEEVRATAATLDRDVEVEDVSMALVRFSNGAMASIVNSALSPRQETYLRLDYQRATVELTHLYGYTRDNWKLTLAPPAQDDALQQAWQSFPTDVGSTHGAQLNEFVRNMDRGECPRSSGADARRTIELLTAIYKSAITAQPVLRGTIEPGDPYYSNLHGGGVPDIRSPHNKA
ncbi:Gfo/Idh/MocA family protein [Actomonas aquatica]|uniref:Gfo/Idh/MocA family oxidoreductase n=1 Tax=Actomonas aquatica TaxID=2866162 RepID=A0ABZ1CEC4_9BACT|nr:Gfo/Idh/MocA family oxidoreductase [Opitutus sp. WL0086]WRQ89573.1 Gfo/Idh/MocA family oxidoreductase [Opitutus sp. WL0086]